MATTLYGYDEAMERMKHNQEKPNHRVALDQDFYTNNRKAVHRKDAEIAEIKRDKDGDSQGLPTLNSIRRNRHAIGGVVKERRGFYDK